MFRVFVFIRRYKIRVYYYYSVTFKCTIIWSNILPRLYWYGGQKPIAGEKTRKLASALSGEENCYLCASLWQMIGMLILVEWVFVMQ